MTSILYVPTRTHHFLALGAAAENVMFEQYVAMTGWFFAKDGSSCTDFKHAATFGLEIKP